MSEFGEAVGGAVEGGFYARALEPDAGKEGHTREGACLNCGTELLGSHCHACGQKAHVHRTIAAFMQDLLHGALHFEGKIWHTLPLLAFKPGKLTRRYIDGQRARFVSPMALFLFSVFLMFAVFQLTGISAPDDLGPPVQYGSDDTRLQPVDEQLSGLRQAREEIADGSPAAPIVDAQIEALERRTVQGAEVGTDLQAPTKLADQPTGIALLDDGLEKWGRNPELMAYKLQANFYKFSWLLIPLSIPFVWLLFARRRRFTSYDHAIFVTYSLSFMSLLFVTIAVLGQIPWVSGGLLFFATVLIPPAHLYKQLRHAYGLSRVSALWRTMVLLAFITVILLLFVNLLLVLGALG